MRIVGVRFFCCVDDVIKVKWIDINVCRSYGAPTNLLNFMDHACTHQPSPLKPFAICSPSRLSLKSFKCSVICGARCDILLTFGGGCAELFYSITIDGEASKHACKLFLIYDMRRGIFSFLLRAFSHSGSRRRLWVCGAFLYSRNVLFNDETLMNASYDALYERKEVLSSSSIFFS